jgi:hypothetical protein
MLYSLGLIAFLVDLLLRAFGLSRGRGFIACKFEHHNRNQLSSQYSFSTPLLTLSLTGHNSKVWIVFVSVSTLSHAFLSHWQVNARHSVI